jgi:hypothetical protein
MLSHQILLGKLLSLAMHVVVLLGLDLFLRLGGIGSLSVGPTTDL